MKQAYLIEIDDNVSLKGAADKLGDVLYLANADESEAYRVLYPVKDAIGDAIPVSESLAWQAKRDVSMEKSNEQTA